MREQNALPCEGWITACMKAKDDVNNVGAGRAAKGANPSLRAKNTSMGLSILVFFCSSEEKMKGETGFFDLLYRSFFLGL